LTTTKVKQERKGDKGTTAKKKGGRNPKKEVHMDENLWVRNKKKRIKEVPEARK